MTLDIEVYFNLEGESKEVWDCLGDLDGKHVPPSRVQGAVDTVQAQSIGGAVLGKASRGGDDGVRRWG